MGVGVSTGAGLAPPVLCYGLVTILKFQTTGIFGVDSNVDSVYRVGPIYSAYIRR